MGSPLLRRAALLCGIVGVAFGVRLAWTLWAEPTPTHYSDAQYYDATAHSVAHGDGYSVTFGDDGFERGGEATALWPPGYSFYLAGWYRVFGDGLSVARTANIIAGCLTVVPIFFIGRRLFNERTALLGAAIAAMLPSFVIWTPVLLSETLFTFLFACSIALMLESASGGWLRPLVVVATGVSIGFAALVRGQALVLMPIACVWWLLNGVDARAALRWGAIGFGTTAIVLGVWTARNAIVMGEPIALSANFGYNLRIGHAGYSTGRYLVPTTYGRQSPASRSSSGSFSSTTSDAVAPSTMRRRI